MFIKSYKRFILEAKDKSIKHAGEDINNETIDKDAESKVNSYLNKERENCARCGEHEKDCICADDDYWSTQNYHRAPKIKK